MTIEQLEYFCMSAEQNSFRQAADLLFLSPSAVSQSIRNLENELGFDLFQRDCNRLVLTSAGNIFYSKIQGVLDQFHSAVHCAEDEAQQNKNLTVGYLNSANPLLISPVISEHMKMFPEVSLHLSQCTPPEIEKKLLRQEIHLAFTSEYLIQNEQLDFMPLYRDTFYIYLPADHELAGRSFIHLEDLKGHSVIVPPETLPYPHMQTIHMLLSPLKDFCRFITAESHAASLVMMMTEHAVCLKPGYACPMNKNYRKIPFGSGIYVNFGIAYKKPAALAIRRWLTAAGHMYPSMK